MALPTITPSATAPTAAAVGAVADGVIVGSAIVNLIADHAGAPDKARHQVSTLVREMRQALDD
jgi:tryptophan synthase alpha chain